MTFFLVVTEYYVVICIHILPLTTFFISSAGLHLTKFSSFLPHFNKEHLEKNFFVALRGAPALPARPDYAYDDDDDDDDGDDDDGDVLCSASEDTWFSLRRR